MKGEKQNYIYLYQLDISRKSNFINFQPKENNFKKQCIVA
jgi:hypothetical protein